MAPPKKSGQSGGFKKSSPARGKSAPSKGGKPSGGNKRFVANAGHSTRKAFGAAVDAVAHTGIVAMVKKAFFIGLGASAVSGEKIRTLAEDLLKQGWLADHDVNEFVTELKNRAQKEADALKEGVGQVQEQVQSQIGQISEAALSRIIDSLGLVRQRDLAQLRTELTSSYKSSPSAYEGSRGSSGGRPSAGRPPGARGMAPRGGSKPYAAKSYGDKPTGDRPASDRPYGRKPSGASADSSRPLRKPGGFKPSGSRGASGRPYRKPS
ncbi:MAG: hypothetical protein VKK59_02285 [Vampirovibrionales bacterium]|nr:hypothetical protein [Vampirovibrionales bacterium]